MTPTADDVPTRDTPDGHSDLGSSSASTSHYYGIDRFLAFCLAS